MRSGSRNFRVLFVTASLIGGAFLLSGCAMDVDTYTTSEKVRLERSAYSANIPSASLDATALMAVSDHYQNYGHGPVEIFVTYDPASRVNTAMQATGHAERIAGSLKARNVPIDGVDILPVHGQGDISQTRIFYNQITAHAPEGCYQMGGLDRVQTQADWEYRHGCTVEMQLARQIASPKDLAGREGLDVGSGRRQGNIVEVYKTGAPAAELEGETIDQ